MSEITKIIFFIEFPFSQSHYEQFGIEPLRQSGFEIEIWDFTPFLHPQVYKQVGEYKGYRSFLTQTEAILAISHLIHHCFVMCFIGYSFYSLRIYQALSKNNIKYGAVSSVLPSVLQNTDKLTILIHRLKKLLAPNYLMVYVRAQVRRIFRRIPYSYLRVKPATLVLAVGEKYTDCKEYSVNSQTEVLWIHNWDYDAYLKEIQQPAQVDPKIGVFLDQYAPFHTDAPMMGIPINITADEYYPLLCRFFDFLEGNYGVQIIIAAHPRSHYEEHPDYFGGRQVIKGKTIELCRRAGFAIAHSSMSINFAILFNKPIIFTTLDKFQQSPPDRTGIETMASALGKNIININNFTAIDWEKELKVDKEIYRKYRIFYIKNDGSDELPSWQIFANRLKKF